jgi:hypothetical protein
MVPSSGELTARYRRLHRQYADDFEVRRVARSYFGRMVRFPYRPPASKTRFEWYADYGPLSQIEPLRRQHQTLFAVIDYKSDPVSVEFGVGHGFTGASDTLVLKMILSHDF